MATRFSPSGDSDRREGDAQLGRQPRIVQNLIDLGSRDNHVASTAEVRLGELNPTAEELLHLLDHRNPFVRSGAARELHRVEEGFRNEVIEALQVAIDDPNDHVVEAALSSLGLLRATSAHADICACLDDSNSRVIHAAIVALGRIGPSEEGAHLVRFLESETYHLQIAALTAIDHLRYRPAIPNLIALLEKCLGNARRTRHDFELPRRCLRALVNLKAMEAVPLLLRMAKAEVGTRGMAVQALIDLKAETAGPALFSLLSQLFHSHHEERLCSGLMRLMREIDYRLALPEMRRYLQHPNASLREVAIETLAAWGDQEAKEIIRQLCYNDTSAFVRPSAVQALLDLEGLNALPDLEKLAKDSNALVRRKIAEGLHRLQPLPEEGTALLASLEQDPLIFPGNLPNRFANLSQPSVGKAGLAANGLLPEIPCDLQAQIPTLRAILQYWLNERKRLALGSSEVDEALKTLLGVLGTEE